MNFVLEDVFLGDVGGNGIVAYFVGVLPRVCGFFFGNFYFSVCENPNRQ
jgi:hypothetical protein